MTELETPTPEKESYQKFMPVLTIIMGLVSIGLFIGINLESEVYDWDVYKKWGAPSSLDLFDGSYWGLVTANFLHTEIWHIALNLYWIWVFGKKIEFESNKISYAFLVLTAALVSSLAQLGFSGITGIGLSGIGYAFFGYLLIKNRTSDAYKGFLEKRTINLFLIWLVVCIFLTELDILPIGNAAHIGGLIWGMFLAFISKFAPFKQWIFGSALFLTIATSFLWNPLATTWLSHQAFILHENKQYDEAILLYEKILRRDSDNEFARTNLDQLRKNELYEKAYQYHSKHQFDQAREAYNEILKIDPNDAWAKENLNMLPR